MDRPSDAIAPLKNGKYLSANMRRIYAWCVRESFSDSHKAWDQLTNLFRYVSVLSEACAKWIVPPTPLAL